MCFYTVGLGLRAVGFHAVAYRGCSAAGLYGLELSGAVVQLP